MTTSSEIADNRLNAFADTDVCVEGATGGPLSGLTFAAKDIFDVAGHITGCGNPDWKRTHGPAQRTASAVQVLLDAGATLVGKTHTDELTRGILGQNPHYGTPTNPAAPGRAPGGSSSGSAAVVAGRLVDFALGSDTGGSVRIPASFCGLYGMRPTHGRISLDGVLPQAPSFDTIGWFARDAATFAMVGEVLLQATLPGARPKRLLVAEDLFAVVEERVRQVLLPLVDRAAALIGEPVYTKLSQNGIEQWMEHQRTLQGREAWESMGEWISENNPRVGFDVAIRYLQGMSETDEQVSKSNSVRQSVVKRMSDLLADGTIVCMPTAPTAAPGLDMPFDQRQTLRTRIGLLMCTGGMTGFPQINIPMATVDGLPVGLSFMGARGTDEMLMRLARELADEM